MEIEISYCIPCHNRTHDLKQVMPSLIAAANASPPVEIIVLNYSSPDDLSEYMQDMIRTTNLVGGSMLTHKTYKGAEYFAVAHARNLSALASSGEFLIFSCADYILDVTYFQAVRDLLKDDCLWLAPHKRGAGILGCNREEFINTGGYDERFNLYGKEDKELTSRLTRRGGKFKLAPLDLVVVIYTSKDKKYANIASELSRRQVEKYSKAIYDENIENKILFVNEDGWGAWK